MTTDSQLFQLTSFSDRIRDSKSRDRESWLREELQDAPRSPKGKEDFRCPYLPGQSKAFLRLVSEQGAGNGPCILLPASHMPAVGILALCGDSGDMPHGLVGEPEPLFRSGKRQRLCRPENAGLTPEPTFVTMSVRGNAFGLRLPAQHREGQMRFSTSSV